MFEYTALRLLGRSLLGLALMTLGACGGPEIPEYDGKTLQEWIRRARGPVAGPAHTAERQREEALRMLGEIGAPAVPALGGMVSHPDKWISAGALEALRKIGPEAEAAIPDLIEGLKAQKRAQVRRAIPGAMVAIAPEDEAVQIALVNRLADADDGMFNAALGALRTCFQRAGPASEAVGRRLRALKQAGLNSTREEMIRGLPGAAQYGW